MGFYGILWDFMGFYGILWDFKILNFDFVMSSVFSKKKWLGFPGPAVGHRSAARGECRGMVTVDLRTVALSKMEHRHEKQPFGFEKMMIHHENMMVQHIFRQGHIV